MYQIRHVGFHIIDDGETHVSIVDTCQTCHYCSRSEDIRRILNRTRQADSVPRIFTERAFECHIGQFDADGKIFGILQHQNALWRAVLEHNINIDILINSQLRFVDLHCIAFNNKTNE